MGIQRWDMDGLLEYSARTGDVIGAEVRPYEMEKGSYVLFTDHEQVVAELTELSGVLYFLAMSKEEFPDLPDGWDWDRIESSMRKFKGGE
jgi:hypothetical protein